MYMVGNYSSIDTRYIFFANSYLTKKNLAKDSRFKFNFKNPIM